MKKDLFIGIIIALVVIAGLFLVISATTNKAINNVNTYDDFVEFEEIFPDETEIPEIITEEDMLSEIDVGEFIE
ncbi:MAG: hypothetical protein PHR26_01440 [Candidatus ainarchaeum sp.]|nr:hypothetical protein [Candidatus ainarchaeum sp.]MDD3976302.1 hypothetical protein [Candidatus ainarchaeum sp.]